MEMGLPEPEHTETPAMETPETFGVSTPPEPEGLPEPEPQTEKQQEFEARVQFIMDKFLDPETGQESFYRAFAELYVFISDFDTAMREMIAQGGPMAMVKALMGRGG